MFRYAQKMDLPALFFIVTALLLLSTPYAALDAMRTLALKTVASFSDALRLPGLPKNSNIRSLSFASGAASGENILQEAPDINSSSNPNWWLDSGAVFYYAQDNTARTVEGNLPANDPWRREYVSSNPSDTDNGYHPQNIFRLVTLPVWGNSSQQAYFKIIGDNLSSSPNRNLSNGLLLFNRYKGSDNLYYAGLRVDGYAVIKKKANGTYYTMDEKPVFAGIYNHDSNPDLLPKNQWLGIRADTSNLLDGSVRIELFTDIGDTGNWTRVLDVTDNGKSFGGAVFASGHGGIRTDFMDVEFKDYMITGE